MHCHANKLPTQQLLPQHLPSHGSWGPGSDSHTTVRWCGPCGPCSAGIIRAAASLLGPLDQKVHFVFAPGVCAGCWWEAVGICHAGFSMGCTCVSSQHGFKGPVSLHEARQACVPGFDFILAAGLVCPSPLLIRVHRSQPTQEGSFEGEVSEFGGCTKHLRMQLQKCICL